MTENDVTIIGAGPAGLAAAIASARAGRTVRVLEKNDRPGRKLLLTGNGRCNVYPARDALGALDAFGRTGRFLRDALAAFDWPEFLDMLGVRAERDESDGRHYLRGGSRRMLDALVDACNRAEVEIVTDCAVTSIAVGSDGGFDVTTASPGTIHATHLIVATGGFTWAETGSTGDAFAWARALGHGIDEPRPALGAIATEPCFTELAGTSVPEADVTLRIGGKRAGHMRGPLLFTHRGISGPQVLDLSMALAHADKDIQAEIILDLLPEIEHNELERWLIERRGHRAAHIFRDARTGRHLSGRLVREWLARAEIDPEHDVSQVPHAKLRALAESLKAMRLDVKGLEDPERGIVTLGGVSTRDVNPKTMESRIVPGLFFAGEVLSPAGLCGGYNLLSAFATGTLAGESAQEPPRLQ